MKISDNKIIEFLAKSPVQSFSTIRDTLKYLQGSWIPEEVEYELFDCALGDNPEEKAHIRVPHLRGISANALFQLTRLAEEFHFLRRRPSAKRHDPENVIVFYEVTGTGKKIIAILEAIEEAKKRA